MPNPVKYIPDGYHTVTPYLIVAGAADAIEFYQRAFNAVELLRVGPPGGVIGHAEIKIGDSIIMLADESPNMGARGPKAFGGSPMSINLYVPDADATVARALAAGATISRPLQDQFYGDRSGTLIDPFGHQWTVSTHIEDISPEEIHRRATELFGG